MSKKSGLGAFVTGALLGGALGVLFAPKKGSETRAELKAKMDELIDDIKDIDVVEVRDSFLAKVEEIKEEIKDLDAEKVKEIALDKATLVKIKCEELVELAKEKGTPVVQKASQEVRKKAIAVTKDVLKKLED